ncbi:MAG: SAM-dependent methyltransferase [Mogibacterium sp.]|nr:SAM-dependent methyltransferase [Mogibacterium sp.]
MRLSKRIYALADVIKEGDSVADIGTDHGYVPMILMKQGKSPHVIMSDISEGSLSKAKETFAICHLEEKVSETDFRIGDGLQTIGSGEVDELIIAGLGGHTIKSILADDEAKSKSFSRIVLQPRKHSGTLRYYLYTHGWNIESELLAEEGKFACEIITAVPSSDSHREAPYPEDDIRWKYPEELAEADPELALKRIRWKISSLEEQAENLSQSGEDHKVLIKKIREDQDFLIKLEEKAVNALKSF